MKFLINYATDFDFEFIYLAGKVIPNLLNTIIFCLNTETGKNPDPGGLMASFVCVESVLRSSWS